MDYIVVKNEFQVLELNELFFSWFEMVTIVIKVFIWNSFIIHNLNIK